MENANKGEREESKERAQIFERGRIPVLDATEEVSNLCVARNSENKVIAGTEKGCYLLSLEHKCVVSTFHNESGTSLKEVPTAIFAFDDNNLISLATENVVLCYDIRQNTLDKPVFSFKDNSDEVNQLSSSGTQLAACDDSGEVKVYDIAARKLYRTLRNKHKNICSTVCFRGSNSKELISGSLDCQVILWDFSRIKVLFASSTQNIFQATDGDSSNYMVNPPMVNIVDCTDDGQIAACGLGNGSIILYEITKARKLKPFNILKYHSSLGASCLKIHEFGESRFLLSGGNDCKVNIGEITLSTDSFSGTHNDVSCGNIQMQSKINHLSAFTQNEKLFTLACDQSSQVVLLEIVP